MSLMPKEPGYAWEIATLYPEQGEWNEDEYLDLTDHANRGIELNDGRLEFLTMPTGIHEAIVQYLLFALHPFVEREKLGKVYSSGIRLRIRPRRVRLPARARCRRPVQVTLGSSTSRWEIDIDREWTQIDANFRSSDIRAHSRSFVV